MPQCNIFAGYVESSRSHQTQGCQIQADKQSQSQELGGTTGQTEVGADGRVRFGGRGRLDRVFRRRDVRSELQVLAELQQTGPDSQPHGTRSQF